MASSDATQRAVLAGLSCGIGLAAPVVMYAATLPFSSVNETVVAGAVPFAVGAVAGVASTQPRWAFPSIVPSTMAACLSPMRGRRRSVWPDPQRVQDRSIPAQQQGAAPQPAAPLIRPMPHSLLPHFSPA